MIAPRSRGSLRQSAASARMTSASGAIDACGASWSAGTPLTTITAATSAARRLLHALARLEGGDGRVGTGAVDHGGGHRRPVVGARR